MLLSLTCALVIVGCVAFSTLSGHAAQVGDISAATEPLLSAAPWAFSIWGVVYAWTIAFAVWQLLPARRALKALDGVRFLAIGNALFSALWIALFTGTQFVAAFGVMLALLATLVALERATEGMAGRMHWFVRAPFTLNLGWIVVATGLNANQLLLAVGGRDSRLFAALTILAALVVGVALVGVRRARWAGAAIAWGLTAVAVDVATKDGALATLAVVCALAMAATCAASLLQSRHGRLRRRVRRGGTAARMREGGARSPR